MKRDNNFKNLAWTNWMVNADFPTPPPPTTTKRKRAGGARPPDIDHNFSLNVLLQLNSKKPVAVESAA